jgi:hypothetical protein
VDDAIIQKIAMAALDDWNGKASPKGGRKTSPSTLRALG